MKNKALLLFLVMSLVCAPISVANATVFSGSESEIEANLQEKVYTEVLSGNITNEADVIRVALAQYEERSNKKRLSAYKQNKVTEDNSLSITQIIDTDIDENGNVLENFVTTNLLVLDKNKNLITADSIETGSGQLSEYQIYAYMNVSVTNETRKCRVRFNWFDTTLVYGTALTAGSLIQASTYCPEPFSGYDDKTIQINAPQGNVAYKYVPNNTDMIYYNTLACGRACRSIINAGSKSFILGYSIKCENPQGKWETEFN
ncbi:hypothetical protein SH1V18_00090 [Vallitalea longa]|uniref:Uncharacterized protein n=1 Tax=Vallitalea longa TaxID=2936439 RepID=A0A9W6DEF6_9FIRM|nr:hypothetical protein [Vallitalea longa]GKX27529.1 hypothetical protein SH1V18_00090 [Vallitalea longa]